MPKINTLKTTNKKKKSTTVRKKVDPASKNLNKRIDDEARRQQKVFTRGRKKIHVLFDGKGIQSAIIRYVNKDETKYVVGCIAWLSNKAILRAMAKKKGVTIVCTKDRLTKRSSNQNAYKNLEPAMQGGAIRVVGEGKGWHKSLMHHKFLIGLDNTGKAIWVSNGSFNMTEHATTNLENLMIMEDPDVANAFLEEFKRVHKLSKPLKLK